MIVEKEQRAQRHECVKAVYLFLSTNSTDEHYSLSRS